MFRRRDKQREQVRQEQEAAGLSWPVRRDGQDLLVSVVGPRGGPGGFARVDPPAIDGLPPVSPERIRAAVESLTPARGPDDIVATEAFAAPREGAPAMTFLMSITLADVAPPEAPEGPDVSISPVRIGDGRGRRVMRVVQSDLGLEHPLPLFSSTYLAATGYGLLTVALATPHVGGPGAGAFAELFDAIGLTGTVTPRHTRTVSPG